MFKHFAESPCAVHLRTEHPLKGFDFLLGNPMLVHHLPVLLEIATSGQVEHTLDPLSPMGFSLFHTGAQLTEVRVVNKFSTGLFDRQVVFDPLGLDSLRVIPSRPFRDGSASDKNDLRSKPLDQILG